METNQEVGSASKLKLVADEGLIRTNLIVRWEVQREIACLISSFTAEQLSAEVIEKKMKILTLTSIQIDDKIVLN